MATEEDIVIVCQQLREGIRQIGAITGAVNVEELLDTIFKDFCIGKWKYKKKKNCKYVKIILFVQVVFVLYDGTTVRGNSWP